jgi:hypothetical protein
MAEAIASNEASVPVPVALSKLFNRAIETRMKVTHWFQIKSIEAEKDSNERHHYFITVLENAFKLLRLFVWSGLEAHRRSDMQGAASDRISFEICFANLTVEDIAKIAEQVGAEEAKLPEVTEVIVEQNQLELEEELKFAVSLFPRGMKNMIDVACAQWRKYKDGEIDLIVASMTTDVAIKSAQRVETEFDLAVDRP